MIHVINFHFSPYLDFMYAWVWGLPLLILLLGVGVYLTIRLKGLQFTYLPYALKLAFGSQKVGSGKGDISNFQSLMTALAATIGIGNIAGVATALTVGGRGALFWMWVTALIGMATKYAEALLAVKYRTIDKRGEMCGGPMYFIQEGLNWRWLAAAFAFFGAFAAFGGGNMLQANSVSDVMSTLFDVDPLYTGIVIAVLTGLSIVGGIHSIGNVASFLVPLMAFLYIGGGLFIIFYRIDQVPSALYTIFSSAFTGEAALGGFTGASLATAIQVGVSRGLMTSEAGLGTASIAAAAAKTDLPGRQALVSMTGSFLATIVMCSVTGLLLGVTNVFGLVDEEGKLLSGASLTLAAFSTVFPNVGGYIVAISLLFFAFTTIIGWGYYGEKCTEYLLGEWSVPLYRIIFTLMVIPGAVLELDLVWKISDIFNGLMAFPNLIALAALSSVVIRETKSFLKVLAFEQDSTL